jgi:hypothetical protein
MTGWNQEGAELLYHTILEAGGPADIASYWKACTTEVLADHFSIQQANLIAPVGLHSIYAGTISRVFAVKPGDPHPMGYLRIMHGLAACKLAFGKGPWDEYARAIDLLYPTKLASPMALRIVSQSMPIIPLISKTLSMTKMKCFGDRSLDDLYSMKTASPDSIKMLLNKNLSSFNVTTEQQIKNPIQALVGFGIMNLFGGRSMYWITEEMRKWLTALGDRSV